jgi:hypothetical protein
MVYSSGEYIVAILPAVLGFVFLMFLLILLDTSINPSPKSKKYRKMLTDLYVAAKIKFLAKEDNLDLVEEYESFKKWLKKERIENKDLDQTIEEELKERVQEGNQKQKK